MKVIMKFDKNEINIINNFISAYNTNYNGDLESFIKKPKMNIFIPSEQEELVHVFNTLKIRIDNFCNLVFDPLYKTCKNADAYMMFLAMHEIKNGNCVFVINYDELMKMSDDNKNIYYSYYLHVKLMFECAKYYNNISMNKFITLNKNKKSPKDEIQLKYIILCPYLYLINSDFKDIDLNVENVSQDIPFTNSDVFNKFIFDLWLQMIDNNKDVEE